MNKKQITFIGNISRDKIVCTDRIYREVWGGSALYSAIATRKTSQHVAVAVYSAIGKDLNKEILSKNSILSLGTIHTHRYCNSFLINEIERTCVLEKQTYLSQSSIPNKIQSDHIHLSLRKGIQIERILTRSKLITKTFSIDVMIHSVTDQIKNIKMIGNKITHLFCNSQEYPIIKNILDANVHIFITDGEKPLTYIYKGKSRTFDITEIPSKLIISSTGAGDTFTGSFLGHYIDGENIEKAIINGIDAGTNSLFRCGI